MVTAATSATSGAQLIVESANTEAIRASASMSATFGATDRKAATGTVVLWLVESGGDNLTATFSPALVDAQIFVLDVAGGGDVARKGGPGIARADLLVINKIDLAPGGTRRSTRVRWRRISTPRGRAAVSSTCMRALTTANTDTAGDGGGSGNRRLGVCAVETRI